MRKFLSRFRRTKQPEQIEPQIFGNDDHTQLIERISDSATDSLSYTPEQHRYAASAWARRTTPIYLELAGDNDPLAEAREAGRLPLYVSPVLDPNDPLAGPSFRTEVLAA